MDLLDRLLEIALTNAGSAAVLALVAAVAQIWLRRPAIVRGLWVLVLLKLMTPPIYELGLPLPGSLAPADSTPAPAIHPSSLGGTVNTPTSGALTAGPFLTLEAALLTLWLFGALAIAVLALIRTVRFRQTLDQAEPAAAPMQSRVDDLATAMGLARSPKAAMVDHAISPLLWAAPRSLRLIVPKALLELLSAKEIDTLFAHELAHLRRGDHWVRYLELTMIMTRRTPTSLSSLSRSILTLAALGLLAVFPTIAQNDGSMPVTEANPRFSGEPIDLDAGGTPLGDVLRGLASKTSLNIVIAPNVDLTSPVTTTFEAIPWDQALSTVINNQALTYSIEGNLVWISGGDYPAGRDQIFQGDPINASLENADLRSTLQSFCDQAGIQLDLDPAIQGQVTLELKEVPWDQVVDAILRINKLQYTIEGQVLKVRPAP